MSPEPAHRDLEIRPEGARLLRLPRLPRPAAIPVDRRPLQGRRLAVPPGPEYPGEIDQRAAQNADHLPLVRSLLPVDEPLQALRHRSHRKRRHARRQETYDRIFAEVPFDIRSVTIGRLLDAGPAGTWAIATPTHFIAYSDGFVADNGAWFSRKPERWFRANPEHDRVARRRLDEAVRFDPPPREPA